MYVFLLSKGCESARFEVNAGSYAEALAAKGQAYPGWEIEDSDYV